MTFDEYMRAVESGKFPEDPRVPANTERFVNENGSISNMALGQFGGVTLIHSRPKTIRSNHYHKTDYHFLYVLSGSVHYYWRPVGSKNDPKVEIFRAGEMFFTGPMVEHAVVSPRSSEMLSISKIARRPQDHEADLVHSPLVRYLDDEIVVVK